jgi:hypothetical protein
MDGVYRDVQDRCDREVIDEIQADVRELLSRIPKTSETGEAPQKAKIQTPM